MKWMYTVLHTKSSLTAVLTAWYYPQCFLYAKQETDIPKKNPQMCCLEVFKGFYIIISVYLHKSSFIMCVTWNNSIVRQVEKW